VSKLPLFFAHNGSDQLQCGSLVVAEVDNLHKLWGLLTHPGLGIGGIVVPASIMATIICPDDLIGTITALTLDIRVLGGSVGYTAYYNVFVNEFVTSTAKYTAGSWFCSSI
jgi:hypothetical protein